MTIKTTETGGIPLPPVPAASDVSPRESSGRVRKASIVMQEYQEAAAAKVAPPQPALSRQSSSNSAAFAAAGKESKSKASVAAAASSSSSSAAPPQGLMRQESSDRSHRLSHPLKKCAELLKELSKHPQSSWFQEPVDYLRLNLPDYPIIIPRPMDFSTIRKRIESGIYDSVDNFADDVRLVFRNAITFNTLKDNPVHIAAREMSSRFEDRFRVLTTQLSGDIAFSTGAVLAMEGKPRLSTGGLGAKKNKPKSSLGGFDGFNSKPPKLSSSVSAGPRMSSANLAGLGAYLPPAVDGSSAHMLMQMQQTMLAMQNEITTLKSQVRESEIVKRLQETK